MTEFDLPGDFDPPLDPEEEPHEWWDRVETERIAGIVAQKLAAYRAHLKAAEDA